MKKILLLGAGRSATVLIDYLLNESVKNNWLLVVADADFKLAKQKTGNHQFAKAKKLDITNEQQRIETIKNSDIVISLLPPHLHLLVAKDSVRLKKNLVTASYVSKEIQELDKTARENGTLIMCELGLDPGIDHMSAMKIIDKIKRNGGKIVSFKSYCGGLIAPESDDNPWHYKFTWNPRNVVVAGQGTACFIENSEYKYIPYNRIFSQIETIDVPQLGEYEAYANRDSLHYRKLYGLENIPTLYRATIRYKGYCKAWNSLVKLGWTEDTYKIIDSEKLTYKQLVEAFIGKTEIRNSKSEIKIRMAKFLGEDENSEVMQKLDWLGIFSDKKTGLKNATPAMILQRLLQEKWRMKESDKDMIIMQHYFEYDLKRDRKKLISTMVIKGEDSLRTAMAKTVGLPLGIFVKLFLKQKIKLKGVQIPTMKQVYEPILEELKVFGIDFNENEKS